MNYKYDLTPQQVFLILTHAPHAEVMVFATTACASAMYDGRESFAWPCPQNEVHAMGFRAPLKDPNPPRACPAMSKTSSEQQAYFRAK